MKKIISVAVLMLSLLASTAFGASVSLKVANSGPENPDNRTVRAGELFRQVTLDASNGELEVIFFHANKLGAEREALEGIQMGTIDMGTLTSGPVAGFFPPVMIFDIPYLLNNNPAAWQFLASDFVEEFNEAFLAETGIRILAVTENGFRHFTSKGRAMKSPKDLQGLKIRTMESPAHMAMVSAMGADPTPIAFSELYSSLQQGVVDGMECPIALIHDSKFYEVQDNLVMDGHLYNPMFVFISERAWKKLSPEHQVALQKGADAFAFSHAGFNQAANLAAMDNLKAGGMNIYYPTNEELDKFKNTAQNAGLKFIQEKVGAEWTNKALAAAKKANDDFASQDTQKLIQGRITATDALYSSTVKK